MADMEKLGSEELEQVAGGKGSIFAEMWRIGTVSGTTNYLALRTKPEYNSKNEIGKLHNGDTIEVRPEIESGVYIWAKAHGQEGWVNGKYVKY